MAKSPIDDYRTALKKAHAQMKRTSKAVTAFKNEMKRPATSADALAQKITELKKLASKAETEIQAFTGTLATLTIARDKLKGDEKTAAEATTHALYLLSVGWRKLIANFRKKFK